MSNTSIKLINYYDNRAKLAPLFVLDDHNSPGRLMSFTTLVEAEKAYVMGTEYGAAYYRIYKVSHNKFREWLKRDRELFG